MAERLLKILAPVAATVLAVVLLASCGGESSNDTGTGSPDAAATTGNSTTDSTVESSPTTGGSPTGDSTYVSPQIRPNVKVGPLRVRKESPAQFREVGDYTTLSHGQQSTLPAMEEAARVVHEFLVAKVRYDWDTSCSLLGERSLETVDNVGGRFDEVAGEDCPTILAFLLGKVPKKKTYVSSEVRGGVFRVRREGGYFFYRAGDDIYMAALSRNEDGEWKLSSFLIDNIN